jgi:hypothetical protein
LPEASSSVILPKCENPESFDLRLTLGYPFYAVSFSSVFLQFKWINAIGHKKAPSHFFPSEEKHIAGTERWARFRSTFSLFELLEP